MAVPIGVTECALDARFSQVRTRETNAGNFVADLLRKDLHGDCALINGGTLRADRMQGPGEYKVKDLVDLLPMPTQCVLLEIQGVTKPLTALGKQQSVALRSGPSRDVHG
jgi:2',3'-cyclic-nucleotide 2'-phosphodiesterase (5'-nucleotidase family)